MAQVISVSRRTDVPAFYADWFMQRVRAGRAAYRNPFNGHAHEVSLQPADVLAFVFWSRNYTPLRPYLDELDQRGDHFYFHFTLTAYGLPLEPFAPPAPAMIALFHTLAQRYTPQYVLWRFDPIVLTTQISAAALIDKFGGLAEQLRGATTRCYVSFVDLYRKTQRNLKPLTAQGCDLVTPDPATKIALLTQLVALAQQCGMTIHACCEPELLTIPGIQAAHCVDPRLLAQLCPARVEKFMSVPTRTGCGCVASRDIGAYDTCIHGCRYCYANSNHAAALTRFHQHDPQALMLTA